mgnify:CR=1 FL=1
MLTYIGKRLLALLPTVAVPMVLLFLLLRLSPGDPAAAVLGDAAAPEEIDALRQEMGLDQPIYTQFVVWLGQLVTFNLVDSLFLRPPWSSEVRRVGKGCSSRGSPRH